jgi:RHS repeat-associated protein
MQVLPRTTEPPLSSALAAAGESGTILYDGQDILRETRTDGTTTTTYTYVHGPGVDEPLARIDQAGSVTYYHADGLGSIVKMTDSAGAVVQTRQYDAWGNIEVGADQPGYAFTGREWDPEIGLYYYRARYYDPKVGRFISEDPIGFAGGMNFYGYVHGNPTGHLDPFGLSDLNYFHEGTRAAKVAKAWSEPGYYTVAGHGEWNTWAMQDGTGKQTKTLSVDDLAKAISRDPNWQHRPVRLGFCWVGRGYAREELEKALGVPVEATREKLIWDPDARYTPDAPYVIDPKGGGYRRPTWTGKQR